MSESDLPPPMTDVPIRAIWPKEWHSETERVLLAGAAAVVIVAGFIAMGIYLVNQGDSLGAFLIAACSFFVLAPVQAVVLLVAMHKDRREQVFVEATEHSRRPVTLMPNRRTSTAIDQLWRVLVVVPMAFYLVYHLRQPDGVLLAYRDVLLPVVAVALAAPMAVTVVFYFFRGSRRRGLGLSRDGVYSWHRNGCSFFPWDCIDGVRTGRGMPISLRLDSERPMQPDPEETWVGRIRRLKGVFSRVPASQLAIHPALAYRAVQYYHLHWDRREELGTVASLERIKNADFDLDHLGSPDRFLDELYFRDESGKLVENRRAVEHYRQNPDQLRALLFSADSEGLRARFEEEEKRLASAAGEDATAPDAETGNEPGDAGAIEDEPTGR